MQIRVIHLSTASRVMTSITERERRHQNFPPRKSQKTLKGIKWMITDGIVFQTVLLTEINLLSGLNTTDLKRVGNMKSHPHPTKILANLGRHAVQQEHKEVHQALQNIEKRGKKLSRRHMFQILVKAAAVRIVRPLKYIHVC